MEVGIRILSEIGRRTLLCARGFFFEEARHVFGFEARENAFEVSGEDSLDIAPGFFDAVIGDAILRKIVGANLFTAVAGADLGAARIAEFFFLPRFFGFEEAGAQDGERFIFVLVLGFFVLAGDDETGWNVCDADGAFSCIDGLSAGTG